MGSSDDQRPVEVWRLARGQHGVVARRQLVELGFSARAIKHRLEKGRLHRVAWGVYAVGRPSLTQHGRWMAAVLTCGPGAFLSHDDAAMLWEIRPALGPEMHVSVPGHVRRRRPGILVHRRTLQADDLSERDGIPVTSPICTLIDLAAGLPLKQVEAAVNEADKRDLVSAERLRHALDHVPSRPGFGPLRDVLDARTFALTDSELERRFLALVRKAGLPLPETGQLVNGFKVDFFWPDLGLVVETDGLRYHRTAAQQARDRVRDQAHTAAGLIALRFTDAQVRYQRAHVLRTLADVARL